MIKINDKIRIVRLDKYCLELQEYRLVVNNKTKEEREDWVRVGYYGDLKSAIGGVLKHCASEMAEEEINGCDTILKRLDEIDRDLKREIEKVEK